MPDAYDIVVLGGGNAVNVALAAGKRGLRTALIEEGPLGGTCPNRGCIPSKLLIGYADAADAVREAGRFHVEASLGSIDGAALLAETFAATRQTDGKLAGALAGSVELVRGRGRFVGERTVAVGDRELRGERVVIGTGGRPRRPDVPGLDGTPFWTSRDVFELERLPRSLVIVGGGYIACEMAHFFRGAGVDTTLVHRRSQLLREVDEEARVVFQAGFTERVTARLESHVVGVSHDGAQFTTTIRGDDGTESDLVSEALLFAIGRVPNTHGLGLDTAGVEVDASGFVRTDDHLRTTADGVYALGDVIGGYQFTHSATREAAYLSAALFDGGEGPIDYGPMPFAVFTSPEVAGVGATEQQLLASGTAFEKASVPYTSAAKGRAIKEAHGLCKFLVAPGGEILGCHLVGREASVLLHEVIPVMRWRNRIDSLTDIVHIHPSLSEVVRNAARKAAAKVG